jgi:NADPH-dependent curcumin reductase CurA
MLLRGKKSDVDSESSGFAREPAERMVDAPMPVPGEGELLVRNEWLSLDPYMRGRVRLGRFGFD